MVLGAFYRRRVRRPPLRAFVCLRDVSVSRLEDAFRLAVPIIVYGGSGLVGGWGSRRKPTGTAMGPLMRYNRCQVQRLHLSANEKGVSAGTNIKFENLTRETLLVAQLTTYKAVAVELELLRSAACLHLHYCCVRPVVRAHTYCNPRLC